MVPFDRRRLLPGRGYLYFFYDFETLPAGQDPEDRGGFRVLFHSSEQDPLERRSPPKDLTPIFPSLGLHLAGEASLPQEESPEAQVLKLAPEEWDLYFELLSGLEATETLGSLARHKLLGYADPHQGDMRLDCQVVASGRSCRQDGLFRSDEVHALDAGLSDWQLLLQLDSEESLGWDWEGGGRLYFLLPRKDLRASQFENCWAILQAPM
jgi:uncharacterized protein YwqG